MVTARIRHDSRKATALFTILAIATLTVAALVSRDLLPGGDVLAAAVAVDLLVTLPLLFLATVVATGRARPLSALVVVVAGGLLARVLVPQSISWASLGVVLALAELALIMMVVSKVRLSVQHVKAAAGDSRDLARALRMTVSNTMGTSPVARLVAMDLTLITYAVVGWWLRPELPMQAKKIGDGGSSISVSIGLGLAVLCEGAALHPLLWRWHPAAAVVHGLLALWALFWILGDLNGLRLRPSYCAGDRLVLRQGLRWQIEVPSEVEIKTRRSHPEDLDHKCPDRLDLSCGDGPTHILELSRPCTALGLFREREVREVAMRFNDSEPLLIRSS